MLKYAIFTEIWLIFSHPMHPFFSIFQKLSLQSKIAHDNPFILSWLTFSAPQNTHTLYGVGAPRVRLLKNAYFCPFQQVCGRNSNKCCFLATNVVFCETSSLKSSKFVLNFVRSQNIASLKSYHFLKFCKFLDFHRPKSLSLSWRRKG